MNSYWIDSTENLAKEYPTLSEDIDVDVCIIGAGLVGITSAYFLSNTHLKVAVVERDKVCAHVSGHSTAKITSQHNLFYDYLINSYGQDFAKGYLEANEEAVKGIKKIIEKEKIDCDFEVQDAYVYAITDKELTNIKKEMKALKKLDFPAKFVKELPLTIQNLRSNKISKSRTI